jgi:hypothetical protein
LKRARGAGVQASGFQSSNGRGIAAPGVAKQVFRELVLLFEVGGYVRMLIRHGRPSSKTARVRLLG